MGAFPGLSDFWVKSRKYYLLFRGVVELACCFCMRCIVEEVVLKCLAADVIGG